MARGDLLAFPHQTDPPLGLYFGAIAEGLLRTGQSLQKALSKVGGSWDLSASAAGDSAGLIIAEDPTVVPYREGYRLTVLPDKVRLIGAGGLCGSDYVNRTRFLRTRIAPLGNVVYTVLVTLYGLFRAGRGEIVRMPHATSAFSFLRHYTSLGMGKGILQCPTYRNATA
jgi:hypothetical protein